MDELLAELTPTQVFLVVAGVFAMAIAGINAFGSAAEKVSKGIAFLKRPNTLQDEKIAKLEQFLHQDNERLKNHDAQLSTHDTRIGSMENSSRVTQRALLALLDHAIDGNSTKGLYRSKEEIQDYLTNK